MKRVIYSEWIAFKANVYVMSLDEVGQAEFIQFGVNFKEKNGVYVNYTTAIIKLDSGQIKNIPCDHIRFIDK